MLWVRRHRHPTETARATGSFLVAIRKSILVLVPVFFSGGCVQFEQTITINPDRSVDVVFQYSMAESAAPVLSSFRTVLDCWQQGREVPEDGKREKIFNRRQLEKFLKDGGARLVSLRTEEMDGRRFVRVACHADDIAKVLRTGVFGDFTLSRTETGDWRMDGPALLPNSGGGAGNSDPALAELMQGVRAKLTIITPAAIVRTSAPKFSGRCAVWDLDLGAGQNDRARKSEAPKPVFVVFHGDRIDW